MGEDGKAIEKTLRVSIEGSGIHARVATMIVRALENYSSGVTLTKDGVEVNARSVLGLLLLAAEPGAEVVVRAEGPDADEVIEEIGRLIEDDPIRQN